MVGSSVNRVRRRKDFVSFSAGRLQRHAGSQGYRIAGDGAMELLERELGHFFLLVRAMRCVAWTISGLIQEPQPATVELPVTMNSLEESVSKVLLTEDTALKYTHLSAPEALSCQSECRADLSGRLSMN